MGERTDLRIEEYSWIYTKDEPCRGRGGVMGEHAANALGIQEELATNKFESKRAGV